jgi:Ras-related protein Rab-21
MAPLYYRNAKAAVVVFDINDEITFRKAEGWVDELKKHVTSDIVLVICANKVDMLVDFGGRNSAGAVGSKELSDYTDQIGALLFLTSAKADIGVQDLFTAVAIHLVQQHVRVKGDNTSMPRRQTTVDPSRLNHTHFKKHIKRNSRGANSRHREGCC